MHLIWKQHTARPPAFSAVQQQDRFDTFIDESPCPHLFRDCAATTVATADPEHVGMIASLLGHTNGRTSEAYYNQAKCIEAARASYANIRQLRRLHRPLRTKKPDRGKPVTCVP